MERKFVTTIHITVTADNDDAAKVTADQVNDVIVDAISFANPGTPNQTISWHVTTKEDHGKT